MLPLPTRWQRITGSSRPAWVYSKNPVSNPKKKISVCVHIAVDLIFFFFHIVIVEGRGHAMHGFYVKVRGHFAGAGSFHCVGLEIRTEVIRLLGEHP